jgi:hypothetical protein
MTIVRLPDIRSRRTWFVLACVAIVVWEFDALFLERSTGSRVRKSTVVNEFGAGETVSQTFVSESDGLAGFTVWMRPDGAGEFATEVRCELSWGEGTDFVPVYRWTEWVRIAGPTAHTFRFPLVERSGGRTFRVDLRRLRPVAGQLGLEASLDDAARPGALYVDGREQWGDLRFKARLASRYRTFLVQAHGMPDLLRRSGVHLSLLALCNWALMTFAYYVVVEESSD